MRQQGGSPYHLPSGSAASAAGLLCASALARAELFVLLTENLVPVQHGGERPLNYWNDGISISTDTCACEAPRRSSAKLILRPWDRVYQQALGKAQLSVFHRPYARCGDKFRSVSHFGGQRTGVPIAPQRPAASTTDQPGRRRATDRHFTGTIQSAPGRPRLQVQLAARQREQSTSGQI